MPVTGDAVFLRRLRNATKVGPSMSKWANDSATEIMEEARRLIKDGGVPPPNHVVSAPGSPANEEYGDLTRDMMVEDLPEPGSAAFIAYSDHAIYTEFGTQNMVERPWARPATSNKRKTILANARTAINNVMRKR